MIENRQVHFELPVHWDIKRKAVLMRIKQLVLNKFGPFKSYTIPFVEEDQVCMLITGKNDEGKTNIINALKLIDAATKVIKKKNQEIFLDQTQYWKLLKQDTENMLIGRMTHNYEETIAEIHAQFEGYFSISVYVDPTLDIIYADCDGGIPADAQDIFGFIPPLGPLSEREEMIGKVHYLRACLNSSIAPRHLRNHLMQTLTSQEVSLVKEIIKTSWKNVELLDCERDYQGNRINYYYREGRIQREIAWAGQGLQVWFQIITHIVPKQASFF